MMACSLQTYSLFTMRWFITHIDSVFPFVYQAHQERHDNSYLRSQNDKLKAENAALQSTIRSVLCSNCGGPTSMHEESSEDHQLRLENAKLKEEVSVYVKSCWTLHLISTSIKKVQWKYFSFQVSVMYCWNPLMWVVSQKCIRLWRLL